MKSVDNQLISTGVNIVRAYRTNIHAVVSRQLFKSNLKQLTSTAGYKSHHQQIFTSSSAVNKQSSAKPCVEPAPDRPVTQSMDAILCMERIKFGPK